MKKYFVVSDIHSFYNALIEGLKRAGYDQENPNHILVVCGDIFDRGGQPLEVYNFLISLPKERRVLIRGNHEYLLRELINRQMPYSHDESNGTWQTLLDIAGINIQETYIRWSYVCEVLDLNDNFAEYNRRNEQEHNRVKKVNHKIFHNRKVNQILKWIFDSNEWVNFFETPHYIFVHGWIPLLNDGGYLSSGKEEYDPNWREASTNAFELASWGCPWKKEQLGFNQTGKTIVCGHWHTSDFWNNLDYFNDSNHHLSSYENPIYISDKYPSLIGIDSCTALTHVVNVLVLNEDGTKEIYNA